MFGCYWSKRDFNYILGTSIKQTFKNVKTGSLQRKYTLVLNVIVSNYLTRELYIIVQVSI